VRVLLAGGGSGGSASPLLAVAHELRVRDPSSAFLYVGTRDGPERALAAQEQLPYLGVAAGKLRRYWSAQNLSDLFRVGTGLAESMYHVRRFRPDVAFGAGGFASVPPLVAAALLGVPVLVHQQDLLPGLANRLLVPFARRITVSMPQTLPRFPPDRSVLRGNPVRRRILAGDAARAAATLGLERGVPLLLATGGGTGALGLKRIVAAAAPRLTAFCQVLHLSGRGRGVAVPDLGRRYRQVEFLVDEMPHVLAAAALVVSRAGMSTLSELAALGKPALVVPMPDSHQQANAAAFAAQGAALVVEQRALRPDLLVGMTHALLADEARREVLSRAISRAMPRDAAARIADDLAQLAPRRRRVA